MNTKKLKTPFKAYKVFNSDWTCNGFRYKVGKTYNFKDELIICQQGFHACLKLSDCFNYYTFNSNNKVAEVSILGDFQIHESDSKIVTNKIKIEKELNWHEVLDLCNSGDRNSGNENSGNWNSGDRNSGNWNSGGRNSGNWNSGNWNSGGRNSGNWNSGDRNSGNWNSGDRNSGDRNSGNWNSGDRNSGDRNSGNWNSGDRNSGYLNTNIPDKIRVFNKWITQKQFEKITLPSFFYFNLCIWISHDSATQQEKIKYKQEIETCGGFLKTLDYKEAWKLSYKKASKEDKQLVKKIPGFDADLFYEITGIKVK